MELPVGAHRLHSHAGGGESGLTAVSIGFRSQLLNCSSCCSFPSSLLSNIFVQQVRDTHLYIENSGRPWDSRLLVRLVLPGRAVTFLLDACTLETKIKRADHDHRSRLYLVTALEDGSHPAELTEMVTSLKNKKLLKKSYLTATFLHGSNSFNDSNKSILILQFFLPKIHF